MCKTFSITTITSTTMGITKPSPCNFWTVFFAYSTSSSIGPHHVSFRLQDRSGNMFKNTHSACCSLYLGRSLQINAWQIQQQLNLQVQQSLQQSPQSSQQGRYLCLHVSIRVEFFVFFRMYHKPVKSSLFQSTEHWKLKATNIIICGIS